MPPAGLRVEALRGAITLDTDSREEVLVRTAQMLGELLQRALALLGAVCRQVVHHREVAHQRVLEVALRVGADQALCHRKPPQPARAAQAAI